MALRHPMLPLGYPGAPSADPGIIRILEHQFPPDDPGWERELHNFLGESCRDLCHDDGAELVEAASLALARVHLARNDRAGAREVLQGLRDRAATFTRPPDLAGVQL